jgi:hypothetical protein
MGLISQLVALWRARLAHVRPLAADPAPAQGSQWLWRVRERILTFLISRYDDPVVERREEALTDLTTYSMDSSLFEVEAEDAPPRSRERLGSSLREIKRANFEAWRSRRSRWLFF